MKEFVKGLIKRLPIAFTKNQKYDRQTQQILKRVCKTDSNCIDIGCHKGEVLDIILQHAPNGRHFGFEPLPHLFENLAKKYQGSKCSISNIALSNKKGTSTFNYVISNPAYSGLKKRQYDKANEEDTTISVTTDRLENVLPEGLKIDLIKIDVEGGEFGVLDGARSILRRDQPVVIFEHGLGASEFYGTKPEMIFQLFEECGLKISIMRNWLRGAPELSQKDFQDQFHNKLNYYFIAHP